MGLRTVRLTVEEEALLRRVRAAGKLGVSAAFKRGLRALEQEMQAGEAPTPWKIYKEIDLGTGGYALGPASRAKELVAAAIRRKHGR